MNWLPTVSPDYSSELGWGIKQKLAMKYKSVCKGHGYLAFCVLVYKLHVYMYICVYIYLDVYIYTNSYISIHMYTHKHVT